MKLDTQKNENSYLHTELINKEFSRVNSFTHFVFPFKESTLEFLAEEIELSFTDKPFKNIVTERCKWIVQFD